MATNDDIINSLPIERQKRINEMVNKEIAKWGGVRINAGRKPKNGVVLKFQVRVSEKEKEFLKYARAHNLNYDDLMQG